jgi:hypothetical protein
VRSFVRFSEEAKVSLVTVPKEFAVPAEETSKLGGGRLLASAALIGAGVLVEPELLGGALLGAGIVYGLPILGQLLRPVVTTAVQIGYSTVASVGDLLGGTRDQLQGIVATARSDYEQSRGSSVTSRD